MHSEDESYVMTEDDVHGLARSAGLPLAAGRAAELAAALEADLRAIRVVRTIDAGETYPAGSNPMPSTHADV